jgi:hypothetical protein
MEKEFPHFYRFHSNFLRGGFKSDVHSHSPMFTFRSVLPIEGASGVAIGAPEVGNCWNLLSMNGSYCV